MEIKIKNLINIALILLLLIVLYTGQASAQTTDALSNAVYLNPSYIQELAPKTNCDLNGAWSTEYSYYWLANPSNLLQKLPSYIKGINYTGVVQESSSISISTPESPSSNDKRNKYYLSSSLPGETLTITLDLENTNDFISWLPLNLYFDPFIIKNPQEQIKLKLSYADSSLGDIIYIQNTKFNVGCYLNLLIKSPDPKSIGKLTIEIDPQDDSTAAISGIFWSEPRAESNLKVTYTGLDKVSAPVWSQSLRSNSPPKADLPQVENTVIWSPRASEVSGGDDFVKIGIGKITSTTSTGYEFPTSLKNKDFYNFKVLQGMAGPKGVNGLEFYLNPDSNLCSNGCELGLYSTESSKQNVFIYSAEKGKKNKLEIKAETPGDGSPVFQKFHIDPNSNVQLRIRLTTNDPQNHPILRGLYISPTGSDNKTADNNNAILNTDKANNSTITDSNITTKSQPGAITIPVGIIQIPQAVNPTTVPTMQTTTVTEPIVNPTIVPTIQAITETQPLITLQINSTNPVTNTTVKIDPTSTVTVPTAPVALSVSMSNATRPNVLPQSTAEQNKAQEETEKATQKAQQQGFEQAKKTAEDVIKAVGQIANDIIRGKFLN